MVGMERLDAIIAGGGPAGLYMARLLDDSGLNIAVLEEHKGIGKPNHCSGLISKNLDRLMRLDPEWIEHKVSGAVISSGSCSLKIRKPGTAAYIIDRSRFDASLAEGLCCIRLGTRVEGVRWREGVSGHLQARNGEEGVLVKTNKSVYKANVLIGCDGANSIVARSFGSRPKKLLMGVIGITAEEDYSKDVQIIIDKKAAPDGFFWKIPRGRTTEYGMFAGKADFMELGAFFGKRFRERRAGLIPLGPSKTYFERTLLVGDAAGMSKPWSGGGVIWGLTAARIAANTVIRAFEKDDFSEGFLSQYERGWKKVFGRQVQAGMLGRKVFEKMDGPEIGLTLKMLELLRPAINRMDMDFLA